MMIFGWSEKYYSFRILLIQDSFNVLQIKISITFLKLFIIFSAFNSECRGGLRSKGPPLYLTIVLPIQMNSPGVPGSRQGLPPGFYLGQIYSQTWK